MSQFESAFFNFILPTSSFILPTSSWYIPVHEMLARRPKHSSIIQRRVPGRPSITLRPLSLVGIAIILFEILRTRWAARLTFLLMAALGFNQAEKTYGEKNPGGGRRPRAT